MRTFNEDKPPLAPYRADRIVGDEDAAVNAASPPHDPRLPDDAANGDTLNPIELRVKKLRPSSRLPHRATPYASGFDLYACLDAPLILTRAPLLVPAGIAIEFPPGYDVQVRPRSGLSAKGVGVAFGTIDADYRGELFVTMWTFGDTETHEIRDGDRIAQLVIAQLALIAIVEAPELTPTDRGDAGTGSTGR